MQDFVLNSLRFLSDYSLHCVKSKNEIWQGLSQCFPVASPAASHEHTLGRSPFSFGQRPFPLNHFDRRALPLIIPIRLFNRIKGGCFSL